jgi:hypothetical protein
LPGLPGNPSGKCILQKIDGCPDRPRSSRGRPSGHDEAGYESNMRHDRLGDHFRREPYPSRRDPHGGPSRRGRPRMWTGHAARRRVRACRLMPIEVRTTTRLRRCAVHGENVASRNAAAVRFRKCQLKKPAAGFPARAPKFLR